jgi:hypothetical protein
MLAVRADVSPGGSASKTLDIQDLEGREVLKADIRTRSVDNAMVPAAPVITLRTPGSTGRDSVGGPLGPSESNVLGTCRLGVASDGQANIHIYNGDDVFFGSLSRQQQNNGVGSGGPTSRVPRYVFTECGRFGGVVFFDGDYAAHSIFVTNEQNEQLANVEPWTASFEPNVSFFKLRVASNVDVGLIMCGLLSIQRLEMER